MSPSIGVSDQMHWQETHKRPGFSGGIPITGFADGSYTLWLPDPHPSAAAPLARPEIAALRAKVLEEWEESGSGRVRVPLAFTEYAAAVIRAAYIVDDGDLDFLLSKSSAWHNGMMQHLIGGQGLVKAAAEFHRATRDLAQVSQGH